MTDYRAIINEKRPEHINDDFSVRHQKMPRSKRAKLFMPFDALSGLLFIRPKYLMSYRQSLMGRSGRSMRACASCRLRRRSARDSL